MLMPTGPGGLTDVSPSTLGAVNRLQGTWRTGCAAYGTQFGPVMAGPDGLMLVTREEEGRHNEA